MRRVPARLLFVLVAAAAAPRPGRAEDAALPLESRPLGLDAARLLPEGADPPDRRVRLAGLPGSLVRTSPVAWGDLEPEPPRGGRPVYRWGGLDRLVAGWQGAGFAVVLVVSPASPWASSPREASDWARTLAGALPPATAAWVLRESPGAPAPRPERWSDWERFVEELVERYDGDGILDAPGLAEPVRYLQVLDRASDPRQWLGSADEYLRLLHHADAGGHRADERLRIVHAAVDPMGLGHDPFPDAHETEARRRRFLLQAPEPVRVELRRALEFQDRTLEMTRLFQAVAVEGSGSLAEEESDLRWLRRLLAERGAGAVEVWLTGSPARKHDPPAVRPSAGPSSEERALRSRWLAAASSPGHSEHAAGLRWLARGAAFDLVRTATLARAAGARRAFLRGATDPPAATDWTTEPEAGGAVRAPSWYAARQWIGLVAGAAEVGDVPAGSGARAVLFRFPPSHPVPWLLVLLRDPDRSWAGTPDGPLPEDAVSIAVPRGLYALEETALDAHGAARRDAEAPAGILTLPLSPAPLYVLPLRVEGGPPAWERAR